MSVNSAQEDIKRYQGLDAIGAVSQAEVAHTKAELARAQAAVQQAEANLQAAKQASKKTSGSRSSLDANIQNAEAAKKQAKINLDNTMITAPESGQLSQVSVKNGQYVSAGTQLMYIVKGVWIIANFKETQIANMTIGEPATIRSRMPLVILSLRDVSIISRQQLAVNLAPQQQTQPLGNYIKIAQRIPVRIDLDKDQPNLVNLRPRMSVSVDVDTDVK